MKRHRLVVIAITLVAIVTLGSLSGVLPFNKAATAVLGPLGRGLGSVGAGLGQKLHELSRLGQLEQQNQELTRQNSELRQASSRLSELEAENSLLRQQLGYSQSSSLQTVGVEVTSYQPDDVRKFVRINQGSNSGISKNAAVVSGNVLVGKVVDVDSSSAVVMLVNDPDFRALVSSQNGNTSGILKSQPGGVISMERIPRNQGINVNDSVITSGLDGEFPKGLLVGSVESVADSSESIFLVATLKPAINLAQLRLLQVVKQ